MNLPEAASVVTAVTAVVISAGSLVTATRSRRDARAARREALGEAQRGNSLGATVDLFREYRSDQMRGDRRILRETLRALEGIEGGVTDLPEPAAGSALRLCHYLDHLGVLVWHGLFPLELVTGFLGVTVVEIWEELHPYIDYERKRRHRALYLEYFEDLAVRVRELDVFEVRCRLAKWDPSSG